MSNQPPRTRPSARRVNPEAPRTGNTGGSGRPAGSGRPSSSGRSGAPPPRRQSTNVNAPRQRDPFPYVLGGILALMVVGIFVVVLLISQNSGQPPTAGNSVPTTPANNPGVTVAPPSDNTGAGTNATPGATPPRMALVEFKALYDDPAQRANMLIIDVRAKESYDAGHIKGSESWPESDIDATVVKLPKDKLIVAYCQ